MQYDWHRVAALGFAIVSETVRIYADRERTRFSLKAVEQDTENFHTFIATGEWLVDLKNTSEPRNVPTNDPGPFRVAPQQYNGRR